MTLQTSDTKAAIPKFQRKLHLLCSADSNQIKTLEVFVSLELPHVSKGRLKSLQKSRRTLSLFLSLHAIDPNYLYDRPVDCDQQVRHP